MSIQTYAVRAVVLVLLAVAGCSSAPSSEQSRATPSQRPAGAGTSARPSVLPSATPRARPQPCSPGARALALHGPHGFRLEANVYGSGRTAAVFLHEIGQSGMCGFSDYAAWLARRDHVRAVLVNRCGYGATTCPQDLPSGDRLLAAETSPAIVWARAHGARRVVVVGASGGGGDALQAAVLPHVDAVVDLSGDVTDTGLSIATSARRVRVPTLVAVAPDDPSCPLPQMRAHYRQIPAHTKRFYLDKETGLHGWTLLMDVDAHPLPLAPVVADWIRGRYR